MKLLLRMLVAPAASVLATVACVGVGVWALHSTAQKFEAAVQLQFGAQAKTGEVRRALAETNAKIYKTLFLSSSLTPTDRQRAIDDAQAAMLALGRDVVDLATRLPEAQKTKVEGIKPKVEAVKTQMTQGFKFAAMEQDGLVIGMMGGVVKAFNELDETLQTVNAAVDADAQTAAQDVRQVASVATVALALFGLVSMGVALLLAWRMSLQITRRLRDVMRVTEAVAEGNLAIAIPRVGDDEVGDLMGALSNTVRRLNTSLHEINQAAQQIFVSSSEVAHGGNDLSGRTEQAAAALEQTSASMQQLSSAVGANAVTAREASHLATTAHDVAARGGDLVGRVVETMAGINDSSKRIADIIGVIDGIAFQTNILALNAAVEAARAGEQGRGFAVVASEVRNLAQRSAAAAKEIKTLISTSVERVDGGTRLVGEAGQTMQEIVGSIKRLDDLMGELNANSQSQASSVGEVSQAVSHMDEMTQQNAALVEQSAAAAESLKEQAGRLASVVGTFKVDATVTA